MNLDIIILLIATAFWLVAEVYLILRDKTQGKGKTEADRRTRNYNFFSLCIAINLAWIPVDLFSSKGTTIYFLIGMLILCLGLFLRYWSIHILGKYFRTTVELEKGQKVIQKGPYKWIRHPSYCGIILFCISYGLALQYWQSLIIVVALPTIALLYRIKIEEEALVKGMGAEYVAYQMKTKKMIPGIW